MAGKKTKNRFGYLTRRFPLRMQRKLVMLFIAVLLVFAVLIGRISVINIVSGSSYSKVVLDQQNYGSRVIAYKRGDIVDRNGTKLASSERVYNVILDVVALTDKEAYLEPTKGALEQCFGIAPETIDKAVEEKPNSRYVVLLTDVNYEVASKFMEIDEDDENYPNVRGVWLENDYIRSYPYGSMASDVVGFTYSGNVGAVGIEKAYNDVLNGTDGREYGYFDDNATVERTVKSARNGNTVVSTIDVTLQSIVEKCILEFNEAHAGEARKDDLGSANTAVIIMNPNTGEILAEASYPNFDLNNPRDLSILYSEEEWGKLSEQDQLDAMSDLWRNFCVSDAYEPGSTFKPFTIAAGLETGTLTGDETYYCGGYRRVGGYTIRCHLHSGHGMETMQDALAYSCNVALMQMAESIGIDNFTRYQSIFGFGQYTGIDLPAEAATSALIYTAEKMNATDLATNSFGQSFNVTMTQMAAAFASLINGGYYYEPHVVKEIQDEDGNVIETKDPVLVRKTVSKETSDQVKEYLQAVMEYGTGKRAAIEGYDIGGKTGTAEKLPRGNECYLLSFIGYAPQENPEVLIYVVIDEPNVDEQANSSLVLELTKNIMEEAFPYLNITMTEDTSDEEDSDDNDMEGTDFDDTEYTDYDQDYEETYDNPAGEYIDEDYQPDLDDWATGENME